MYKRVFALLFSLILLISSALPSIDVMLEDVLEIEVVVSINEEENKHFEFNILGANNNEITLSNSKKSNGFYLRSHSNLHKEHFSPPPERI